MPPVPGRSSIGVRVRPNANDFIKDLEAQLKTKKKTFYVDVHANLKPADRDIREWARTELKTFAVNVPVGANLSPATGDIRTWRAAQRNIKTNIPIGADLSKAYADVLTFRKIAGRDIEVNLKVNSESAARAAERFGRAIERQGITIPVHTDSRQAQREIDTDLTRRLKSQGGIILPVGADTTHAANDIRQFSARAPKVESQLDVDLKRARLQMLEFRLKEKSRKVEVDVAVKRQRLDALSEALHNIESRFGKLTVFRSLDLGPITLGKPTGLIGTLGTITALAGAVPGAVTALAALSKVLVDVAGAAAIVPGAIGGILASLGTLTIGTQGVGDAFSAMFDLWKEGSDQQQSQAKAVAAAHDNLRNAISDEAKAQRDVAMARREATSDLRNLNNELRGSVLNEAQAILDLQKARDRLAKGGFENLTEQRQAELDVAKSQQNIIDVRERNAQLQTKVNDANVQGVEGSDRVTQALENQTRAAQATAQSLQAISDTQAAGATSKFNDALKQLSPNAQEAVLAIAGMKGELFDFRNVIQDTIFAGIGPGILNAFHNLEPILRSGMTEIAQGLNQNILQVFSSLQSPAGQSIIERILGGTAEAQKALTGLIDPVVRGLGTLMAAGAEHLPQVVELFTRLADRFANFIESADKSGKLDEFMDRGIKALEQIAEIGINAIKIVNDLSNAFDGDLLQTIVDLTGKLHTFLSSDEGKAKLLEWIRQARDLWDDWRPILEDLPRIFGAVSDAARTVIDLLTPFLNLFTETMEHAPWLIQGFVAAWLGAKVISGVLSPILSIVQGIVAGAKAIPGLLSKIPGVGPGAGGAAGAGGRGGVAPVIGSAGIAAAGTLAVTDILQRINFASDAEGKYNAWKESRGQLGSDEEKRQLDKEAYKAIGVDLGNETIYPLPGPQEFKSLYQNYDPGQGPQFRAHDGKIWYGDKPVSDSWKKTTFMGGGYTDWPTTIGRAALLHGREYIEPADTVDYYGVDTMKAIHEKRVPKDALRSFQFGGFNWPFPMAPPDPNMPVPPLPTQHGPPPGATPVNPVTNPAGIQVPAPGPVGPQPTPPTEIGPIGSSDQGKQSFDFMGFNIPLGTSQETTPANFADPGIWPFGIPGVGAPGTTSQDAGQWLATWGAKTLGGFGEAVLGGVLGFFGAEGILSSPYFNAIRNTLGYFSSLPGAVSNATQASGADQTNADVSNLLGTYYNMPTNPPGTGAPGQLPTIIDPNTGSALPAASGVAGLVPLNLNGTGFTDKDTGANDPSAIPGAPVVANANVMDYMVKAAQQAGLTAGSGYDTAHGGTHSVDGGQHSKGRALDINGTPEQLAAFANAWVSDPTKLAATRMLIFDDGQGGKLFDPNKNVYAGKLSSGPGIYQGEFSHHRDHIHLALEGVPGSALPPGTVMPTGAPLPVGMTVPQQDVSPSSPGSWWGNGPLPKSNTESVRNRGLPLGYRPTHPHGQTLGTWAAMGSTRSPWMFGAPPLTALSPGGNPASNPLGGPIGKALPTDKEGLKQIAHQMYLIAGMPPGEWGAFDWLINKESSWEPTAKNPSSTAYGLGQFLDTTDAQYGPRTPDPMVQLPRIFQYIKNRYHGSPVEAKQFHNAHDWYDQGGWLPPGQTHVSNMTGKPELIIPWDNLQSFQRGGLFKRGAVVPPMPPPRPPDAILMRPQPAPPRPAPAPVPSPIAVAPPPAPMPGPPPPPAALPGPTVTPEPTVTPVQIGPGAGAGAEAATGGSHLNPAVSKGIKSGFAAAGNLAGMAAGAFGAGGASSLIAGAFGQAGKIVEGIANVGASFLVGTLTNGTTENPYGVTQRASNPTGGTTTIVNRSTNMGDVSTQDPDAFFKKLDLREAQSRAMLGRFG